MDAAKVVHGVGSAQMPRIRHRSLIDPPTAVARHHHRYDASVSDSGNCDRIDDWFGLHDGPIPVGDVYDWALRPDCGAVVLFSGTVRDHAEGRPGVDHLTYEAYDEQVGPRLAAIAAEVRRRWPEVGRIAMLHRTGRLEITESSVVVAVSAPHRPEAFIAARYAIDALKETAPIWKHEVWDGGEDWGTGASVVTEPHQVQASRSETRQPETRQSERRQSGASHFVDTRTDGAHGS